MLLISYINILHINKTDYINIFVYIYLINDVTDQNHVNDIIIIENVFLLYVN